MASKYFRLILSYGKSKKMLTSVVRTSSCSSGWLRLVVQAIFGVIIVSSFILITLLTIGSNYRSGSTTRQRCTAQGCTITCYDAPHFGEFEHDILHAATDIGSSCIGIVLTINNAMFVNSSLPINWLSAIRVNVTELEIVGGNLRDIPSDSFQSPFGGNIRVLVLSKMTITTLAADTFTGLSTLVELRIVVCEIVNISHNALQAIDDTLEILSIRADNHWDPANITGSSDLEQLRVVDFSMNDFNNILGYNSFTELKHCKVLFLNSCKITSIGDGAFDSLKSIEILHLNNNYLISLPLNIFDMMIPREPRISLHDNLWNCSCYSNLRLLLKLDLLIVEPTCFYPIDFRGQTFSSFEKYCVNDVIPKLIDENLYVFVKSASTINHQCTGNSSQGNYTGFRAPVSEFTCHSNRIYRLVKNSDQSSIIGLFSTENNWVKPTFAVDGKGFSMVSLVFSGPNDYGLMWYHTTCPKEMYCINHLPKLLRLYNKDSSIEYTFCRISETSTGIQRDQCVAYNSASFRNSNVFFYKSVLLTVSIAIICLLFGALCVYALIHKNPILLKGNKRVVFVKHKTVDALILPAKTSLKDNLPKDSVKSVGYSRNIFVLPRNHTYPSQILSRSNSIRTNESNDPSYVSALQPTEDQLAEWRITQNFETRYTYDSIDSNLSFHSGRDNNSLPYYSYDNIENIYQTVKL